MPCNPKDLERLAELLSQDKYGETEFKSVLKDPDFVSPEVAQTRHHMGYFWQFRTQIGAFGDEFAVKVVNPIARMDTQAHNITNKAHKDFMEAIKPALSKFERLIGIPRQIDEQIHNSLSMLDENGRFVGREGSIPPEIIQAAQNVRRVYDKYGVPHDINSDTYLNLYRDLAINNPQGVMRKIDTERTTMEEEFFSRLKPSEIPFYHELERKGIVSNPDKTASAGFVAFIQSLVNSTMRKPFIESLEESTVKPFFDLKIAQDSLGQKSVIPNDAIGWRAWEEYKHHLFGGPTPGDIITTDQLKRFTNMFGYEATTKDLYAISRAMTSSFYAGVLGSPVGGRPSSTIRHLFKLIPTIAQLGTKPVAQALEKIFKPGSIKELEERGFISSPMEQIIQATNLARSTGKVISSTTDAFLKLFTAGDKFSRGLTAYASEAKFNDYLSQGIINKLPGKKELRDEVSKLVDQGLTDKARDAYIMGNTVDLQYVFGASTRPKKFRGAIGTLIGALTSYPLNSAELYRSFGKQAIEGVKGVLKGDLEASRDIVPLMRLLIIWAGLGTAGSQFFNADLRGLFMHGALPSSLAFPKMGLDVYQAGKTNIERLTGSLYNVGETNYHKKERQDAQKNFARDMRSFVPGGIFFFEDIPKAIDEGSLVRMLGVTPKAAELDIQAKERSSEKRRLARIQAISGITQ